MTAHDPASAASAITSELFRKGLFREALGRLEASRLPPPFVPEVDILKADLLQRLGDGRRALKIANRYLGTSTVPRLRARAHLVVGTECRDKGDVEGALRHLQKAITFATEAGELETKCWAGLRLMLALAAESSQADISAGFLSQVRTDVARLGDALVTAALHVFVAQIETKRGLLNNALQHIKIGRGLLEKENNAWLDGTCSIDEFSLLYLASDFENASQQAKRALRSAYISGHLAVQRAAIANLGHLCLTSNELQRAELWLRQSLQMSGGGESQAGILDGIAQVKLAKGQLDECERVLEAVTGGRGGRTVSRYYSLWSTVTRLRLRLRQHASSDVLRNTERLAIDARAVGDPSLVHTLQLLEAEALLMTGCPKEAATLVCRVADDSAEKPLETLPRVGRMLARLHADGGSRAAATEWFERSARVLASAADECARSEVLEDYTRFLWPVVGKADAPTPRGALSALPGLRPAAARVTVHPHAATPLAPAAPGPTVLSALERATTLIDLAGRPLCVGQELLELLSASGAISHAAIVSKPEHGAPELLAFRGDYSRAGALLAAGGPVDCIPLGRWRQRDVELRAEAAGDLHSRSALVAARKIVKSALDLEAARREQRERAALWPLDDSVESRFGVFASQAMTEIVATARRIAPTNATVLITGETGTGKEVLARIIHETSPRAARPFIPFNCAAVPRDMLDSQLFGYRRGAFTGAVAQFPGVIRSAAGGTLLLDEIGEIPPDLQPKLLRFLEAQEVQPLGDAHPVQVDVRVLAATNANLDQLLASGRFREDLYYRLNVIRLPIPPLRERREEIPVLAQHFLRGFAEENRKDNIRLAEETMEYLLLYAWPGNVRELLNQMRRLAALAENGAVLMPEHLSPEIVASRRTVPASERALAPTEVVVRLDQPLAAAVEHIERTIVPWALRTAGGRMELAAKMLGLSRKGLYLKRQRLGLDAGDTPAPHDDETAP